MKTRLEWPSNDPVDRAWYIFRKASEEAIGRYGMRLAGCVELDELILGAKLTIYTDNRWEEFKFQQYYRELRPGPNYFFDEFVDPALRRFAEER